MARKSEAVYALTLLGLLEAELGKEAGTQLFTKIFTYALKCAHFEGEGSPAIVFPLGEKTGGLFTSVMSNEDCDCEECDCDGDCQL